MQPQPIRDAHRKRPFKPYAIHTSSGEVYQVTHPEVMAQSPSGNTVMVLFDRDSVAMIDVSSVTEVTFDGRQPAESNP